MREHNFGVLQKLVFVLSRFQILRDLIPHTDQKRDTASFLLEVHFISRKPVYLFLCLISILESFDLFVTVDVCMQVIQYVQYLQEKVQKHEGSYQPWSSEPTKLMPWVNSCS